MNFCHLPSFLLLPDILTTFLVVTHLDTIH